MFEALSGKLNGVFDRLRRRGALSEADVTEALREVRVALLEADVALPVVRDLVNKVRERSVGQGGHPLRLAGAARGHQDRQRRAGPKRSAVARAMTASAAST